MQTSGRPRSGSILGIACDYGAAVPYLLRCGLSQQIWLGIVLPLDLGLFGAPSGEMHTSQELLLGPLFPGGELRSVLPRCPWFVGSVTHWQGFVIDPVLGSSLPLAASNYVTVTIES